MKKIAIIVILFFVQLNSFAQTNISSNVTINQNWVINNSAPWTISGNNVTVTFGENLSLNSAAQYFIITGSNVTIDGANKSVTINGISDFPGLVNAQETNASSALIKNIGVNTIGNTNLSLGGGYISTMYNKANITNCFSTGEISGFITAGIAGAFNYGNINNCYSTGAISGLGNGGITSIQIGQINNCYSTGVISGNGSGGIVGYINYGSIHNCFSTGLISGLLVGGITCFNTNSLFEVPFFGDEIKSGNISNCYTSGEIIGVIDDANQVTGGIAAYNLSTITDCRSSGSLSNINSVGIANNNFEFNEQTGIQTNALHVTPAIPNTFDNSIANQVLTGLGSIWNTSVSPYSLLSFFEPPTFANLGPITICQNGSYFLDPSTTTGTWVSSDPSVATVDSRGYVTGLIPGTTTISLENSGGSVSASITVGSSSELSITDPLAQASYKINNNPQGPIGGTINYVGYNGFNYSSQTRPINSGFYRASIQSGNEAGCPSEFYIYRCTTCGTVPLYGTRPQGTLTGNTIQSNGTGQLVYNSSNEGGPFTIVYQLIGGETKTVTNVSSGQPFNINTYANTTSYKLISVTDESTKSATDFTNVIGTILVVPPPTATLTGIQTICSGATATLTLTTTGTGSIAVTLNNGTIVNTTSGTTTISVSPTINTTYTISSVVDVSGTGTSTGTASVTINPATLAVITSQPIGSVTINEGASTTLSITATGATGYQWYKDNVAIVDATTISYTTVNTVSATGTYYVNVFGACNTSVSSTNTIVSVTVLPQGSLTGSRINQGETGFLSYVSSNGGGPFTIVYHPLGGSDVTVTDVTSGSTISLTTGTPTRTTTYTLVSVTDQSTTLSRTIGFTGATATVTTIFELALNLDAGNISSYPGNGNIWYDLSNNGINASFGTISPTFSPSYGGVFNFDGTQDMNLPLDDLPYGNSAFTLNAWAKATSIDGNCNFIIAYGDPSYGQARFLGSCDGNYNFGGFGGNGADVQGTAFPLNTWVNMTGTYDGTTAILYVNGVQIATGTPNWNTVKQSAFIGKQVGGLTQRWNGSISNIQLYNKALTATEVLNNYNNTKSRFSLSNVAIGTQIWTDKNLDVTTYQNGDVIAQITNTTDWANATEGAWCYYNNDPANGAIYGKLYNWYAVNDSRGLAPIGWHVPTDDEWAILATSIGGAGISSAKLKANSSYWSPNVGNNESGFSALPAGYRDAGNGNNYSIGDMVGFWSSTLDGSSRPLYRLLENNTMFHSWHYYRTGGLSVRLIKD